MEESWQKLFIEELHKKYPRKSRLVNDLAIMLSVERESIYRKLRKETKFSIEEVMEIASKLNISLDNITGTASKESIFKTVVVDYLNPSEDHLKYIKHTNEYLHYFANKPNVEYIEVANKLPRSIIFLFPVLAKYRLLAWTYQYANKTEILSFSQIHFDNKLTKLISQICINSRKINNTTFILDPQIFDNIVRNIQYLYSISIINKEEKELIKNSLFGLLDYMYEMACKGAWNDSLNRVKLYISYTNIESHYTYLGSDEFKVCRVNTFADSKMYTVNPDMIEIFADWVQLRKKASTLISQINEKSRIEFFNQQRDLIQTL